MIINLSCEYACNKSVHFNKKANYWYVCILVTNFSPISDLIRSRKKVVTRKKWILHHLLWIMECFSVVSLHPWALNIFEAISQNLKKKPNSPTLKGTKCNEVWVGRRPNCFSLKRNVTQDNSFGTLIPEDPFATNWLKSWCQSNQPVSLP